MGEDRTHQWETGIRVPGARRGGDCQAQEGAEGRHGRGTEQCFGGGERPASSTAARARPGPLGSEVRGLRGGGGRWKVSQEVGDVAEDDEPGPRQPFPREHCGGKSCGLNKRYSVDSGAQRGHIPNY